MSLKKKILLLSALIIPLLLIGAGFTFAKDVTLDLQIPIPNPGGSPITKLTLCTGDDAELNCGGIAQYIGLAYTWIAGAMAIVAVLIIMWAGFMWMTAAGDGNKIKKSKGFISNALIGLVAIFGSYTILYVINPDLVRLTPLKLNTPKKIELVLSDANVTDSSITASNQQFSLVGQNNVPFFSQTDSRWSYLASSGCGISSFAMIAKFYGKDADPAKVYRQNGNSTSGSYPTLAQKYGLKFEWIDSQNFSKVHELVTSGHPVMMYTVNPKFTSRYHFVVITGFDGTSYQINDPNGGRIKNATRQELTSPVKPSSEGWSYPVFGYPHP